MNCFQIFYLCSSNTTNPWWLLNDQGCELLSDFLSLFFKHNFQTEERFLGRLWIAFRFFIFVLQTQRILKTRTTLQGCELLSDFLSLFFKHNAAIILKLITGVVNCFQIFYLCSSNTTLSFKNFCPQLLWIAFRFFIFVLQTQQYGLSSKLRSSCELLSDFLSLFFKHNRVCTKQR